MTTTSTSTQRIDSLIAQSDRIYDDIDQEFDGEVRYRRMLRVGLTAIAVMLKDGADIDEVGKSLISLSLDLPSTEGPLDTLANRYADVERATVDREGKPETDARHAIHLLKLAIPYAAQYYPNLNTNKIAVYTIIHDLVEAYADDVSSLGISPEQADKKHADETAALIQMKSDYGTEWPELFELLDAYEALADVEARFVKTFDKLDPSFPHYYNKGGEIKALGFDKDGFLRAIDQTTQRMTMYSRDFSQLMEDRLTLARRVAHHAFEKTPQVS